jgi:hypothetical protein
MLMKKIIVSIAVVMSCLTAKAQEPEKKKDTPPPSRGQERAINEAGIPVTQEPKKKSSNAKKAPTPPPQPPAKPADPPKETKKPE